MSDWNGIKFTKVRPSYTSDLVTAIGWGGFLLGAAPLLFLPMFYEGRRSEGAEPPGTDPR